MNIKLVQHFCKSMESVSICKVFVSPLLEVVNSSKSEGIFNWISCAISHKKEVANDKFMSKN